MSSVKINLKIPKPHTEQPIKAARKAIKRRITSDDESDNTVSSQAETPNSKPVSKKPRLSIVRDAEARLDAQPRSQHKSAAAIPRAAGVGKKSLKRKQRIVSDDDEDDGEFVPEPEEKSAMVPMKHKQKDLKGKVKLGSGSGATNGKIIAKNESIITDASVLNAAMIGKKGVRKEEDDAMDVDISSVPPAPAALAPPPMAGADPPKKKLPTIKKKPKKDVTANLTAVSSPAPPPKASLNVAKANDTGTSKPPRPAAAGPSKKPAAPVQATTMNPSGTGDFDLRDTNIWQSLIGKGTLSSGPRVGIEKGISTEERRKQLDKMREEARARRDEQYRHTFDLQAQSQKIAGFEKKFATHRIRMPGPNVLGAAFKVRPIPRS